MRKIRFYRLNEPYGEFSNLSAHPIDLKGCVWPTTEHFFQAQKFVDTELEEAIRQAKSPMVTARMGRSREQPLRPDWETVKDDIMRSALEAKFAQHPALRSLLLHTDDAELIELLRTITTGAMAGTEAARTVSGNF